MMGIAALNPSYSLNRIVNGQEYTVPSTIDDPGVIPEIIEILRGKGFVKYR